MANAISALFQPGWATGLTDGTTLEALVDQINSAFGGSTAVSPIYPAVDAITAHAGGGQTNAVLLTGVINRLTTVASAADSVKLPVSKAGLVVYLVNSGADSAQVFGSGTDTINGVATATGVAQAAGVSAVYFCPVAGKWFRVLSA